MLSDIVMPNGNEEEFIAIAKRLGYKALVFLYSKSVRLTQSESIKLIPAVIGKYGRQELVFASGSTRSLFENRAIDIVYGLENVEKADDLHQRHSGLDHVTAAMAARNEIAIAFSFSKLNEQLIGRIHQNIKLCRKYKVEMIIASFATNPFQMRAPMDIKSLFEVIGMGPGEAKKALSCVYEKYLDKQKIKIKEGVEVG